MHIDCPSRLPTYVGENENDMTLYSDKSGMTRYLRNSNNSKDKSDLSKTVSEISRTSLKD